MKKEQIWEAAGQVAETLKAGKVRTSAVIQKSGGNYTLHFKNTQNSFDVTSLWIFPGLAEQFAIAFEGICKDMQTGTRDNFLRNLMKGFYTFLKELNFPKKTFKAELISSELLDRFVQWLQQKKKNVPRFDVVEQRLFFSVLKRILASLDRKELVGDLRIPTPYFGKSAPSAGRPIIDAEVYAAMLRAAHKEMQATIAKVSAVWLQLDERRKEIKRKKNHIVLNFADLVDFLLELERNYGAKIFSAKSLRDDYPKLAAFMSTHGGFDEVCMYRAPSDRDLVPFVLMLAAYTNFNPETVRGLKRRRIKPYVLFGKKRIALFGEKPRATTLQRRTFAYDADEGVGRILDFVEKWTEAIRPLAKTEDQDRVFLFAITRGMQTGIVANWVDTQKRNAPTHGWYRPLLRFQKGNELPAFTLAQIRGTGLDRAREEFMNDIKAIQVLGGQKSADLLEATYNSSSNHARNDERLIKTVAVRSRWILKAGKVHDPRGEPPRVDIGCATPGFRCFDPFDSPIPGEVKGRLCQGYGRCPACAMGHLAHTDPHSLGRLLQLRKRLQELPQRISPSRWREVWAPNLKKLNEFWLPKFPKRSWAEAKKLTLNAIPELE